MLRAPAHPRMREGKAIGPMSRLRSVRVLAKDRKDPKPKVVPVVYGRPDYISVTKQLGRCRDWRAVADAMREHGEHMSFVNVTAAFTALARVVPIMGATIRVPSSEVEPLQQLLSSLAISAAARADDMGMREVATVARWVRRLPAGKPAHVCSGACMPIVLTAGSQPSSNTLSTRVLPTPHTARLIT